MVHGILQQLLGLRLTAGQLLIKSIIAGNRTHAKQVPICLDREDSIVPHHEIIEKTTHTAQSALFFSRQAAGGITAKNQRGKMAES